MSEIKGACRLLARIAGETAMAMFLIAIWAVKGLPILVEMATGDQSKSWRL